MSHAYGGGGEPMGGRLPSILALCLVVLAFTVATAMDAGSPYGLEDTSATGDGSGSGETGSAEDGTGWADTGGPNDELGSLGQDPGPSGNRSLEHFECYVARPPPLLRPFPIRVRVVALVDQFENVKAYVDGPDKLCNPASKNDEPVQDRLTHLVCYRLKVLPGTPAFVPINVTIGNQFGTQKWTVAGRDGLCVPSEKNREGDFDPRIDHFKCYKATVQEGTRPLKLLVSLADQFGKGRFVVSIPDVLCNPVSKDGAPIQDKDTHLACYRIRRLVLPPFVKRSALVENQFGEARLIVYRPVSLCVPSSKEVPPPPPPEFNHFECYQATLANGSDPFTPVNVSLVDQFGSWVSLVLGPRQLCNPVMKDGGPVPDPRTHLSCYDTRDLAGEFKPTRVLLSNQFGNATWYLYRPEALCEPAEKNGEAPIDPGFNQFRCYAANATEPFSPRTVYLFDQFANRSAVVFDAAWLCTPVSKNGEPVRDPGYHLACYRIDPIGSFTPRTVRVKDQFGLFTWDVTAPQTLCVPSSKEVLGP